MRLSAKAASPAEGSDSSGAGGLSSAGVERDNSAAAWRQRSGKRDAPRSYSVLRTAAWARY